MGSAEEKPAARPGRPTSRDVARLAGVSHTAVSFVFNGRAEGNLSPATQERIRQAAIQLGYRPDPVARGLRRSRTAVIGLVTDEIASSPFAGRLLRGAMDTAWAGQHLVLTVDSGGDPAKEDAAVAELLDRRVDGIIYAAMSLRRVRVPEGLHRTHSVLANCLPEDGSLPAVVPAPSAPAAVRRPGCCWSRGTGGSRSSAGTTTSPRRSGCVASATRCAPRPSPCPGTGSSGPEARSPAATRVPSASSTAPRPTSGPRGSSPTTTGSRRVSGTPRPGSGSPYPATCRWWATTTRSTWPRTSRRPSPPSRCPTGRWARPPPGSCWTPSSPAGRRPPPCGAWPAR
ncbi:HTH-type transcriptional repressor PurR [Streptomyces violarus]